MGKKKQGFNWKARQQPNHGTGEFEEDAALQQSIQLEGVRSEQYVGTNALALPAKRGKIKKAGGQEVQPVGKILSKKQRKRLEKIVDQKKKKENRGQLLKDLASVQTDASLLTGMESLAAAQTKGIKRQLQEDKDAIKFIQTEGIKLHELPHDLKKKVKRRKVESKEEAPVKSTDDVLGFDSSSSSDEDDDSSSEAPADHNANLKLADTKIATESSEKPGGPTDANNDDPTVVKESDFKKAASQSELEDDKQAEANPVPNSCKPVKTGFVPVSRTPDVEESRSKLPIIGEEQNIMETINNHQVVILCGETGSGKTTQVPQFLYEAGYATQGKLIGITEPRRVAATAMSARVGMELGLPDSEVSYQIRFQGNVTDDTKIKFMTDGVLLREVEKDFLLNKYSVIILDEAHERSVFTDILIGLLSRIVPLRHKKNNPLKLIIMSATLRVEDFTLNTRLFKAPPPVINVDARQFPVTVHFNKRTSEDYLNEAFRKVCKIHRQLPEGGILVFLTGQSEVNSLVRKLRKAFPHDGSSSSGQPDASEQRPSARRKAGQSDRSAKSGGSADPPQPKVADLPEVDLDAYKIAPPDDAECEGVLDSEGEEDEDLIGDAEGGHEGNADEGGAECAFAPLHVLPLYSLLSQERQNKVFEPTPGGARLCVVATNIAETSLTIPGVKYVVDCGRVKTKFYDKVTGVTTFMVTWTSKAAANQRAGRAGRQGPGHTYRLYSSAVFNNDMKDFAPPEIQLKPAVDLMLQMKAMNIDKVVNFPFPSPPEKLQLRVAEERLQQLGILAAPPPGLPLRDMERLKFTSSVTPLGKAVAQFPVSPRFGKILALSHQHGLLPHALALVACLSVPEVLVEREVGQSEEAISATAKVPKQLQLLRKQWAGTGFTLGFGDPMVLLKALSMAEKADDLEEFCLSMGLRHKGMKEVRRLRRQLSGEVELILPNAGQLLLPGLQPPGQDEARLLQQLVLAGCGDQVARRIPEGEEGWSNKGSYRVGAMAQPVFIHSASVLRRAMPDWLVFQELFETDKIYMRCITQIQPEWLPKYVPSLCKMGKALEDPAPRYCQETGKVLATFKGTFGAGEWPLPPVQMEYPVDTEKYKLFGRFLLEGAVCPDLAQFTTSLLSSPVILTKSWSNLQPRTETLYRTLAAASVDSGSSLRHAWAKDKNFLLSAYLSWLPEVLHPDVKKLWPPAVAAESSSWN